MTAEKKDYLTHKSTNLQVKRECEFCGKTGEKGIDVDNEIFFANNHWTCVSCFKNRDTKRSGKCRD
jgi:hypothetical protein